MSLHEEVKDAYSRYFAEYLWALDKYEAAKELCNEEEMWKWAREVRRLAWLLPVIS